MAKPELDQPVHDFEAPASGDQTIRLSDFRGQKHVVIYFYPKDNTPGCTTEGQDSRRLTPALGQAPRIAPAMPQTLP